MEVASTSFGGNWDEMSIFSERDSFYAILTIKIFSAGIRTPDKEVMDLALYIPSLPPSVLFLQSNLLYKMFINRNFETRVYRRLIYKQKQQYLILIRLFYTHSSKPHSASQLAKW